MIISEDGTKIMAHEVATDAGERGPELPSYEESTSNSDSTTAPDGSTSSAAAQDPFKPTQAALAHIRQSYSNRSIEGSFILDPSVHQPPFPGPPSHGPFKGKDFPPPEFNTSAYYTTSNGSIAARFIVKEPEKKGRSIIVLHTSNASVCGELHSRDPQVTVDFRVSTSNAQIKVAIPPDFQGAFSYKTSNAKFVPSPAIKDRMLLWHVDGGEGTGTIKPKGGHGQPQVDEKNSDSIALKTSNARIFLFETGEEQLFKTEECVDKCVVC
ncbi:hypothetical protein BT69DRAFT_1279783 [Atractiella rhizophila]|nr:hypothetical protein BT69DRAFT_1279783 [Atractiella rhizophila]